MSRQHYLPAAYLGNFSHDTRGRRRDRLVWCIRRGQDAPWPSRPRHILHVDDLYDVPSGSLWGSTDVRSRNIVDATWTAYEPQLPRAIAELVCRDTPLSGHTWLRTLVPFVTSLFVRGREFSERFKRRLDRMGVPPELNSEDNANMARCIEMQRLLAPVCAARWLVLHTSTPEEHITNDIGLARAVHREPNGMPTYGWVIPLATDAALALVPRPRRSVLVASEEGQWLANIEHYDQSADETVQINRMIAASSRELIVGPSREVIAAYSPYLDVEIAEHAGLPNVDVMDGWAQVPGWNRVVHEFDWHRLSSIAAEPLEWDATVDLQTVEWERLAQSGWVPPIMLPANLPEFASGLVGLPEAVIDLNLTILPDESDNIADSEA